MGGVGGKLKAGKTIHKEANSNAVSSVGHRICHSQRDSRQQRSTPQAALLVPISGPVDSVVDRYGFTGLAKDHLYCESRPGHL